MLSILRGARCAASTVQRTPMVYQPARYLCVDCVGLFSHRSLLNTGDARILHFGCWCEGRSQSGSNCVPIKLCKSQLCDDQTVFSSLTPLVLQDQVTNATGTRKASTAQVWLSPGGSGKIVVNGSNSLRNQQLEPASP